MSYTPGPLPDPVQIDKHLPTGIVIRGYTAEQLSAYTAAEVAQAVAAERERWTAEMKEYGASVARIAEAVERERCAKAAEDFLTKGRSPLGRSVAEAIRAAPQRLRGTGE